jgi:hypothetical protein
LHWVLYIIFRLLYNIKLGDTNTGSGPNIVDKRTIKHVLTTTIQATSSTGKTIRNNADNTMPYNTNKHSSNGFMGKGKNTQNSWPSHCLNGKIIGLHWPLCEPRSAPSSVSGQSFLQPVGTICLETVHTQAGRNWFIYHSLTELDDGKNYRKPI